VIYLKGVNVIKKKQIKNTLVYSYKSNMEEKLQRAISGSGVIVLHGESGVGKKHLVKKVIREYNLQTKDTRVLHVFSPDLIDSKNSKKRFVQLLHNRDVTGKIPVLLITQFYTLSKEMQKIIVEKLMQKSNIRRNTVFILTDGNQEKYNAQVIRHLSNFDNVTLKIPSFKSKKDAVMLSSPQMAENIVDKIAGSSSNFHVLYTKIDEFSKSGIVQGHFSDEVIRQDRFFQNLNILRSGSNLVKTEKILEKLGDSRDFACNCLQINPSTTNTAEQLWQHKDNYSELDTFPVFLQEKMQPAYICSSIGSASYGKLHFPLKTTNVSILSSIESLKTQYSVDGSMFCSRMEALERYSLMKSNNFEPLKKDDEMTKAINSKIRSSLFVWKKEEKPSDIFRKRKLTITTSAAKKSIQQRSRQL
jgi:hypothetical protein